MFVMYLLMVLVGCSGSVWLLMVMMCWLLFSFVMCILSCLIDELM